MFVEKKIIGKNSYYYLKHSFRINGKVKTKTLAYIGSEKDLRKINKLKSKFTKAKLEKIKKGFADEMRENWDKILLDKKEEIKIDLIRKEFSLKLKQLNHQTKKEMFDDFLTYFVFNTNAIEGNTLTLKETNLLLNEGITPRGRSLREINDHLNSKKVFYYLYEGSRGINENLIIKIHDMLLENIDNRKGYRNQNVRVIGAMFEPSPHRYIKTDIGLLLKWYRKNLKRLHPVILASIFHHKFEKIHPFYDGNGRTGRMLLNLILIKNNFPPVVLSNQQRKTYYSVLSKADKVTITEITEEFKALVKFITLQVIKTYDAIFRKWG